MTAGYLIILISCLFMNGGADAQIVDINKYNSPNNIVMNTVISSASAGLTMVAMNQYSNLANQAQIIQVHGVI